MKLSAFAFLTFSLFITPSKAAEYEFDKEHTTILFFIDHLGFSDKIGRFTDYDGTLIFDENKPEKSELNVVLKPSGIRTDSEKLDEVLQGKNWFNTAEFPEMKFEATKFKVLENNKGEVSGWLEMLGEEKYVTLDVTFNKAATHPITGDYVAGFSAETSIQRDAFGMINNIPFIGEEVRVVIETEFIRIKE